MIFNNKNKAIVVLAVGLFSHEVYSATQYSSEGHLSLEVIGFSDSSGNTFDFDSKPADIVISNVDNSDDDNTSTSFVGDAFADAVSTPFSDTSLIDLDTQVSGDSGTPYAFSTADAFATGSFGFENTSLTESYTIDMELNYSYSASVETDTRGAQQNGFAEIDIDLFGDFSLDEILAISISTDIDQDSVQGGESNKLISFELGAGNFETVITDFSSYGESESLASNSSVSEVPVPAAIYLMAVPLIGFVKRKKRTSI